MQFVQFVCARADTGAVLPAARVTVKLTGTSTLATLFTSTGSGTGNPLTAGGTGAVGFAAANGTYDVYITSADGTYSLPPIVGVQLFDLDTLSSALTTATAASTAAAAARDLAAHYANDSTDTDVPGGATGSRGAKWSASVAQAASTAATSLVASLAGIISNVPGISRVVWYVADRYGQMATWVSDVGRLHAVEAHIGTLTVDQPMTLAGFALANQTTTIVPSNSSGMLGEMVDRYFQRSHGPLTDGSYQIANLRDGSGALVYPQVAQAKSDAATATAAVSAVAISALRQKIIAARKVHGRWKGRLMASPPTITSTNTTTTPGSGYTFTAGNDTTLMNILGGFVITSGPQVTVRTARIAGNGGALNACNGSAWEFDTSSPVVYLDLLSTTTSSSFGNNNFRILVNGQYVQAADFAMDTAYPNRNYYRIDFGSSASRRIMIESYGALTLFGFWTQTGYATTKPATERPVAGWIGDSHSVGTGGSKPFRGFAFNTCALLGLNPWNVAFGGSGIFANSAAGQPQLMDRSDDWTQIPNLSVMFEAMGTNDQARFADATPVTEASYADKMRQWLDLFFATYPSVPVISMGPILMFDRPYSAIPAPLDLAKYRIRDAKEKVMHEYPNGAFIDLLAPTNHITGGRQTANVGNDGYLTSQIGLGNADIYRGGSDGTDISHMTQDGHEFLCFPVAQKSFDILMNRF